MEREREGVRERQTLTKTESIAEVVNELKDHEEVGVGLAGQLEARNPGDIRQESKKNYKLTWSREQGSGTLKRSDNEKYKKENN